MTKLYTPLTMSLKRIVHRGFSVTIRLPFGPTEDQRDGPGSDKSLNY